MEMPQAACEAALEKCAVTSHLSGRECVVTSPLWASRPCLQGQ